MPQPLSGPGLGLPLAQNLYPSELTNAPYDIPTNQQTLAPGNELPIAAGTWYVDLGLYSVLEYLDPVTNTWVMAAAASAGNNTLYVKSDGFNVRVANRTGCPVGGVVTAAGSSYVQASTTIAVTGGGGSTWVPIVGGALAAGTIVTGNGGAGYGVAPLVMIPAPAGPSNNANGVGGLAASGYAVIASGTVSGVTLTNQGAGYGSAPGINGWITLYPNPTDPNISSGITLASVSLSLTQAGSLTGVLCTNPGAPLSTPANITLTVSGAGSSGTVQAVMLQTVTAASIVGGSTINNAAGTVAAITSIGGAWPAGTIAASPEFLGLKFRPRAAQIVAPLGGAGTMAATVLSSGAQIVDGGLFAAVPNSALVTAGVTAGSSVVGSSTIVFTMGSRPDIVKLQPAP